MLSSKPAFVVMFLLFLSQATAPAMNAQAVPVGFDPSSYPSTSIVAPASSETATISESSSAARPADEPSVPARSASAEATQGAAPSREAGPFQSVRIAFIASTLGAGFDVSSPIARHFDLRGGANFLSFGPAFDVDGLHYESSIHLRSGHFGLDWFPRHRNFHITPGILYFNNNVTALTYVAPGEQFTLDDNSFVSDTEDPVHGDASFVYSRHVAPMLSVGFNNILPGRHKHISVPLEFGVAYTGAPKISASLVGTACQQDGCFSFAENGEAQQSLKNEVKDINDTLSDIPVYPVLSLGFAYRF